MRNFWTPITRTALVACAIIGSTVAAQAQCSGQFPAGTYCGNNTGSTGLPGPKPLTPGSLQPIAGGTVIGNPTGATAVPVATAAPVLGIPGSVQGSVSFAGATSGTAVLRGQAAAGTPTLLLPTTSGTLPSTASAPLALDAAAGTLSITGLTGGVLWGNGPVFTTTPILGASGTIGSLGFGNSTSGTVTITPVTGALGTQTISLPNTSGTVAVSASSPLVLGALSGALTCPTCVTSSGGGAITGTAPINVSAAGVVSLTTPLALQYGGTAANLTAANGGVVYSTASAMAILAPTATARQMLQSGASAAPAWSTTTWPATSTANQILYSSSANTIGEITTANNGVLITSGAGVPSISSTLPAAVQTNITQLGTVTTGTWNASIIGLAYGGTAANLTASNGGLVYSTASALAILPGTATAGQIPRSGSSAAPSWSTATYPATTTAGTVLGSTSANVIAATAQPVLGANGGTGGQITFNGSTSGSVVVGAAAVAGTGTVFTLPATNGANGQVLSTNGSGVTSWIAAGGTGTVTSITPSYGLTSTVTASPPGSAITTTGTLYASRAVFAQALTSYAVLDSDRAKVLTSANAASQAYSIAQAGAASQFQSGWFADFYNRSAAVGANLVITPTTSTINGAASLTLLPGQSARVVSDGANYVAPLISGVTRVTHRIITSTSSYVPTAGTLYVQIECQGGGGGGGGSVASATTVSGGGGGGAGAYARVIASAATIGSSQAVTIGGGGGGTAGTGGAGSTTSVGSICSAGGGAGGGAGTASTIGSGGSGGSAIAGDIGVAGGNGLTSQYAQISTVSVVSGRGGDSYFGRGANPPGVSFGSAGNGLNAASYGGGGSGGGSQGTTGAASGGNGAAGVVVILEFGT